MITCPPHTRLQEYLLAQNIHLLTACGGRGNCGKCVVKAPEAKINTMDRVWFTEKQLKEGYRLGCQIWAGDEPLNVELQIKQTESSAG